MTKKIQLKGNALALLPLLIFILTFLGAGIWLNDFYAFPSPVAVLLGIIAAFLLFKQSTEDKVNTLISGCGESKIVTMCLIYLLAGAFATVTKAMGGVDSVVNLGINNIDVAYSIRNFPDCFFSFDCYRNFSWCNCSIRTNCGKSC